ncbi:MAG: hypothetical protein ACE5OZ_09885 [Candidatus Heimdallarchaeota archaeon]
MSLAKIVGIPLGIFAGAVIGFILLMATFAGLDSGCSGDSTTTGVARCQFSLGIDEITGLNATPWFQYQVNDSGVWAQNKSLPWAFSANLAFWNFFWEEVQQITKSVAVEYSIEQIDWPFPAKFYASHTYENVTYETSWEVAVIPTYPNGSYLMPGEDFQSLFANSSVFKPENFTFCLSGETSIVNGRTVAMKPAPADTWIANIVWQHETLERFWLDDENWDEIASAIAAELEQTWYVEAFILTIYQSEC